MVDLNEVLREAVNSGATPLVPSGRISPWNQFLDLDESVGDATLVERDFSDALINLVSNAFYAMGQKRKTSEGYEPVLPFRVGGWVIWWRYDCGTTAPEYPMTCLAVSSTHTSQLGMVRQEQGWAFPSLQMWPAGSGVIYRWTPYTVNTRSSS